LARDSNPRTYLRVALLSLFAVLVVAGTLAFYGFGLVRESHERTAAHGSNDLVAEPVGRILGEAGVAALLLPATRQQVDEHVAPLLGADVVAVRIWTTSGQVAYSAGSPPELEPREVDSSGSVAWARAAASDGGSLFVVYGFGRDYAVEVVRDPANVDAAIRDVQAALLFAVALAALGAFVMVQGAFWLGMRRFSQEHRRLLYLYTTGQQIRSSLDLHEVLTQLSRDATALAHADYGLIALFDEKSEDLMLKATFERATGTVAHHQRAVEDWYLHRCCATRTSIATSQPSAGYRPFFAPESDLGPQVALLCVPMSVRDRVVGVLAVLRPEVQGRGGFSHADVRLVEELADQAVGAVEQAQLFAKVRTYADELEMSYDTTLKVLMAALDTKDEVTEGHCERVAKLTVELAKTMGVPENMLVDMERGALLHDVGKIGVPDAVLKKPRALNKMEWEAMRRHPLLAGIMVSKVGFLEGALPILLYHHERYDGRGYPFSLMKDKIPLEARIFAVVDSYDAMTSERPYRAAMPHQEAMEEIRRNSGTQFDPDVVAAFWRMMAERPDLHQHGEHTISPEHDEHNVLPLEDDADPVAGDEDSSAA
jgi:hypothetical protein